MTGSGDLSVEVIDQIAWVRFERPEQRNTLNGSLTDALRSQLARLAEDGDVRALAMTGDEGSFCAGVDLRNVDDGQDVPLARRLELLLQEVWAFPHPTLALVRGSCLGVGCAIATACDVRFAHPDAVFAVPGARLGIRYPPRSMQRLVDLVGPGRANLMLLAGQAVDGARAAGWGLVDTCAIDIESEATAFLRAVADVDVDILRATRRAIRRSATPDLVPAGPGA